MLLLLLKFVLGFLAGWITVLSWNRFRLLAVLAALCLTMPQDASAQQLAGNYIGPAPWFFAPTVIRDPNLHRPTVTYPQPQCGPSTSITINNNNHNNNHVAPVAPVTITNPYWVAPVSGPPIHIGRPAPVPQAKPIINRYRSSN